MLKVVTVLLLLLIASCGQVSMAGLSAEVFSMTHVDEPQIPPFAIEFPSGLPYVGDSEKSASRIEHEPDYNRVWHRWGYLAGQGPHAIATFVPEIDYVNYNTLDGLAYKIYSTTHDSSALQTPVLTFDFGNTAPFSGVEQVWIGIINFANGGVWDWYLLPQQAPRNKKLTLSSFQPYMDPANRVVLTVSISGVVETRELATITIGTQIIEGGGPNFKNPGGFWASGRVLERSLAPIPSSFSLQSNLGPIYQTALNDHALATRREVVHAAAIDIENWQCYHHLGWDNTLPRYHASPRFPYLQTAWLFKDHDRCEQQLPTPDDPNLWLANYGTSSELNAPFGQAPYSSFCNREWSDDALLDARVLDIDYEWNLPSGMNESAPEQVANFKYILAVQKRGIMMQTYIDFAFWEELINPGDAVWNPDPGEAQFIQNAVWVVIVGYDDSMLS
jgi:hypothetical protein